MVMIKSNELKMTVTDIINDYTAGTTNTVTKIVMDTANKASKEIRSTAHSMFKGTGDYADSWRSKALKTKYPSAVVHAVKPHYRLAHLLEKGHHIINRRSLIQYCGDVRPYPHIKPVEEKYNDELVRRLTHELDNG